jgi:hypothetical protein
MHLNLDPDLRIKIDTLLKKLKKEKSMRRTRSNNNTKLIN